METKELSGLAKVLEASLLSNKLTASEALMVVALLQARIISKAVLTTSVPETVVQVVDTTSKPVTQQVPKKAVKYDNLYDPPPPMSADKPPERAVEPQRILSKEGSPCICADCNKVVYMASRDIPNNCKVDYFIDSFTPLAKGAPPMSDRIEIQNIDGNISIDCPICGASKRLYLTGSRPSPIGESGTAEVGSF